MRFRRAKARMFKWALMNDRKAFVQVGHAVTVCKQNKKEPNTKPHFQLAASVLVVWLKTEADAQKDQKSGQQQKTGGENA